MRKILAFFLSFYILTLTCIPCTDQDMNSTDHLQIHLTNSGSAEHAEHQDNCSPFCTCSCCNVSMEAAVGYFLTSEVRLVHELEFFFRPEFHSDIILSIWEPPEIN